MSLRLRAFMGAEGTANILIVDDRPEQLLAMQVVLANLPANIVRAEYGGTFDERFMRAGN